MTDPNTPMGRIPRFEEFIRDHPEHVAGTKTAVVGGREEVVIDTLTMIAFARWSVAKGYADPAKAKRYLRELKRRCYARGIAWPAEDTR